MNILIVDDHQLVRDGIKNLIELEHGWNASISVASFSDISQLTLLESIDVAIIDIMLRDQSGYDVLERIKTDYSHIKCLMLSQHEHPRYISRALETGADGYVTKTAATKEIIAALDALGRGGNYLSSDITSALVIQNNNAIATLTDREKQVFMLLAKGFQPKKISTMISAMPKTVMVHRTNIYKKLGVKSQFDLLRIALREGIVSLEDFLNID